MMWTFGWISETYTKVLGCLLGGGSSQEKFMKVGVEESNMLPSPNAIGGGGGVRAQLVGGPSIGPA